MLNRLPVRETGRVHELTDLVNSEGKVWLSEGEILEVANNASISGRINEDVTNVSRELSGGGKGR